MKFPRCLPVLFLSMLLLFVVEATSARAECQVSGRFDLTSEGPWPYAMNVGSGQTCGHTFRSVGGAIFKRLYVVQPPSNGAISLREGGHYDYTSKNGFSGRDQFILKLCGTYGQNVPGCSLLAYSVAVR